MTGSRSSILVHGIIAGAIGYVVVALLFGLVDYLHARPIYATAADLGALITGRASAAGPFDPIPVFALTAVHFVLMLGAGLLGSLLAHRSTRAELLPVVAFTAGVAATLLASFALRAGLLGLYALDLVWINLAAAAVAITYLVVRPELSTRGSRQAPGSFPIVDEPRLN